jgi:hypothetical protein
MVIVLALREDGDRLELEDPGDVRRFHVRIEGGSVAERISAAFAATGLGRFESLDKALVSVERVRGLATGRVDPGWEKDFEGMLVYAAGKGWYDAGEGTIQAHCELG